MRVACINTPRIECNKSTEEWTFNLIKNDYKELIMEFYGGNIRGIQIEIR